MNNAFEWSDELSGLDEDDGGVAVIDQSEQGRPVSAGNLTGLRLCRTQGHDRQPLYLDMETVPDYERAELFGLPPLPDVQPETGESDLASPEEFIAQGLAEIQKSLMDLNPVDSWLDRILDAEQESKKPRKGLTDAIDKLKKERQAVLDAEGNRRKKMATTPEMCRVVAIGWAAGSRDTESLVVGENVTELHLLERFWDLVADAGPVVGFNIANFDLPVIFVRSALLGIPATRLIDLSPYRRDVLDLMVARFGRGQFGGRLKQLATCYGIEVPTGDVDGSQVEELMQVNPGLVGEYVRSDVDITRALHRFYSGYFCV